MHTSLVMLSSVITGFIIALLYDINIINTIFDITDLLIIAGLKNRKFEKKSFLKIVLINIISSTAFSVGDNKPRVRFTGKLLQPEFH